MQVVGRLLAFLFAPLATLTASLTPLIAGLAHRHPTEGDFALAAFLVSAGLVTIFSGLWAAGLHARHLSFRQRTSAELARLHSAQLFRDALIAAGGQPVMVMGVEMNAPMSFAGGSEMLKSCLAGADAAKLAAAIDKLLDRGIAFALTVLTPDRRTIAVRGLTVGGRVAIFFGEERPLEGLDADGRGVLDALPIPVWVRNRDLALRWVNQAFLDATGHQTFEQALRSNIAFDRNELELAATARDDDEPVSAKRYAMIAGERRALALTLQPLDDVGIAGTALDVTDVAQTEMKLQSHIDGLNDVLNQFDTAVAAFDGHHRLVAFNSSFAAMFDLPEKWLRARPSDGDVLDRMREQRHLPEQRDFSAWKRACIARFETLDGTWDEMWHLPGGPSVRVLAERNGFGGLTFRFKDVSERLRLESTYNSLKQVQRATLDTLDDGVAVVGPDGRVKVYNTAFARLWQLTDEELAAEPHVRQLAEICARRIGRDQTWEIVMSGVVASEPARLNDWGKVGRADGKAIALTLARLPDGSTLATFTDLTETIRFEQELRGQQHAA